MINNTQDSVLAGLQQRAHKIGADAVIGIILDHQDISARTSKGLVLVVAYGTAVKLQAQ